MNLTETTINSKLVFDGKIIKVFLDDVKLPNGNTAFREYIKHNGGVTICAITEERELLFVEQYRYSYKEVVLELPAGKLEKGTSPLENGKRELLEETGATGVQYMSLGKMYPSAGYCGEIIHMYFCKVDSFSQAQPDQDEFVNFVKIPIDKAVEMVLNNEIPDAKTQIAVLKTALLIDKGVIKF